MFPTRWRWPSGSSRRWTSRIRGRRGSGFSSPSRGVTTANWWDCAARPGTDDPRVVEIGVSLARSHQGRGYGTEAVRRLLDYLFDDQQGHPAHRVTAGCDVRNTRSVALLERVGMRREGHFVEPEWFKGEWVSEYRYAVLRREWLPCPAATAC